MKNIYQEIKKAKAANRKLLAILLDPDKVDKGSWTQLAININSSPATHILIGGSEVVDQIDPLIEFLQANCILPLILFPGNPSQISELAHAILFLTLLSGRNPDFLIGYQVKAAPILRHSALEVIPTGYILIESGSKTAVQRVSQTLPLTDLQEIVDTAFAGELLGCKLIYLEAGSGAANPVALETIKMVSAELAVPLIVGGGIRSGAGIIEAFSAGADMVVIGTAFEKNGNFFKDFEI